MHRCDNKGCVRPSHLMIGTHADNMADHGNKRHAPWGERHHWCKMSAKTARKIKAALAAGASIMQAAKQCCVSYSNVYDIERGRAWRHLEV